MASSYSKKQLMLIRDFGKKPFVLHCGCMGSGKTYSIVSGFVFYCLMLKNRGIKNLNFVLLAQTQQTAKRNLLNVLADLAGDDFKYDSSRKSGVVKDATLFGCFNLFVCGLSTKQDVERFRGISAITGIIQEEATLSTEEQFALINSRLRGEYPEEIAKLWPDGYVERWWIGSTNPANPDHYLKKKADSGEIEMTTWTQEDAIYKGATAYFENLKNLYRGLKSLYDRNVLGQWTSAEGIVYEAFDKDRHILRDVDVNLSVMQRCILSVDYGSNHPTAILLTLKTPENKYVTIKELKLTRTAPSQIVDRIEELMDYVQDSGGRLADYGIICDPAASGLIDELQNRGIKVQRAFNSHDAGISCVSNLLTTGRYAVLAECENLIHEFYTYRWKDQSTNGKDEVVKVGDDFMDSLRYAVYTDYKLKG